MPIYEYRCDRCGVFEITQRITEPTLGACPTCHGTVARLISATSFQLKGSGWYVTDYARKGGNGSTKESKESRESADTKDAGTASAASSESSAKTGTASEGKSADKAAAKSPSKSTASADT